MRKIFENKALWITLVVIVALGVGGYFWIGATKASPVEKAMNKFLKAFEKYDIESMKKMAVDPNAQVFEVLEANEPLYKICAKNADVSVRNSSDYPITVKDNKATVILKSTNFNTYAFKYNISQAKEDETKIKEAISKVSSDRPANPAFQLEKVDGKWKIQFEEIPMRELLDDMNFFGDTKVTLTDDVLEQLEEQLAK